MTAPNWSEVSENVIRQIFDQADKHLGAQLTAGLAADQRALSVAAIATGFASALYAAAIGYWSAKGDLAVLIAGLVSGSTMLAGALMCAWAARPVDFFFPGSQPDKWWDVATEPLSSLLGYETENYQEMICDNDRILQGNARWLERGVVLSSLSPVLGLVAWLLAIGLSCPAKACSVL